MGRATAIVCNAWNIGACVFEVGYAIGVIVHVGAAIAVFKSVHVFRLLGTRVSRIEDAIAIGVRNGLDVHIGHALADDPRE